jgi:hypothetical protein
MRYIPMGSFTMGTGDEDLPYAQLNTPKLLRSSLSIWIRQKSQITNTGNLFIWVRDSIARRLLGEVKPDVSYFGK